MPRPCATVSMTSASNRFPPSSRRLNRFYCACCRPARVNRYTDFYGNWVHHFEIPEAARLSAHRKPGAREDRIPRAAGAGCAACVRSSKIGSAQDIERCFDFLQNSRLWKSRWKSWRLAVDAIAGQNDAWQAALAIMQFRPRLFEIRTALHACPHAHARCHFKSAASARITRT